MYLLPFGKLFFKFFTTFLQYTTLNADYKYIADVKSPNIFSVAQVAKAAAMSSATQPTPPSNVCKPLIPQGFLISKNLNKPKPNKSPKLLYPVAQSGIKQNGIATNSSRIILPGSRTPSALSAESQTPIATYAKTDAINTYCTIPQSEFEPTPEKIST